MARDVTDGLSSTISLGEIGTKSGTSILGQYAIGQPNSLLGDLNLCEQTRVAKTLKYQSASKLSQHGRGAFWADGAAGFGLFNTIFAPNHPSCVVGNSDENDGIYSTTSYHAGGVQVARLDGSVQFISDAIDTGDSLAPTLTPEELQSETTIPSRYGIWGALGTARGREKVD